MSTIGTCSVCGGPVTLPAYMVNPVPRCERCGAHKAKSFGPVIEMERQDPVTNPYGGSSESQQDYFGKRKP